MTACKEQPGLTSDPGASIEFRAELIEILPGFARIGVKPRAAVPQETGSSKYKPTRSAWRWVSRSRLPCTRCYRDYSAVSSIRRWVKRGIGARVAEDVGAHRSLIE
jgi:hypothetical protein